MIETAIGLGSNIGKAVENINSALNKMAEAGFKNIRVSAFYRTVPVDCKPGTPDFINAAAAGFWSGSPVGLLNCCKSIEEEIGRPTEHAQDEARIIDLDILLIKNTTINQSNLKVPHPLVASRLFVLIPLAEIAGDWVVNIKGKEFSVKELKEARCRVEPSSELCKKIINQRVETPDNCPEKEAESGYGS